VHALLDLITTATVVAVVGLCSVFLLSYDLVRRELRLPPQHRRERERHPRLARVAARYRVYGLGLTAVFVVLVGLRFYVLAK
jgi:hypothetical protein